MVKVFHSPVSPVWTKCLAKQYINMITVCDYLIRAVKDCLGSEDGMHMS